MRLLLVVTGIAIPEVEDRWGGFRPLFEGGLRGGVPEGALILDTFDLFRWSPGDPTPELRGYQGVVVTGSPSYVSDPEPWIAEGAALLRRTVEADIPLLAVCFGHQLLGVAMGASVGPNPLGYQAGTITVSLGDVEGDPLLSALPRRFQANCTHSDAILDPGPRLTVLGSAAHDPHHLVRAGPRAWGVQFHPDFDGEVMGAHIRERQDLMDGQHGEGIADRQLTRVEDTPWSAALLPRFAMLCREGS